MAPKPLYIPQLAAPPWLRLANLIADEPYTPNPPQLSDSPEDRSLLRRTAARVDELSRRGINAADGPPVSALEVHSERYKYEIVYAVRVTLRRIANEIAEAQAKAGGWSIFETLGVNVPALPSHLTISVGTNGMGVVSSGDFGVFLRMIERVDLRKIKSCPVCPTLFYAARKNQITCSKSHARTLAIRHWRAKQKLLTERAVELAKAGLEVPAIATAIGVTPAVVRQYLTSARKPHNGEAHQSPATAKRS